MKFSFKGLTEMASQRRKAYTKVERYNKVGGLAERKGDVQYKGLNCVNPQCDNFLFFPEKESALHDFSITCEKCGHVLERGSVEHILDYDLKLIETDELVESGEFLLEHTSLIENAPFYKYCILCHSLKLNEEFDKHSARKTGRQGECNSCKQVYNSIKNKTRIKEQHAEAARNREFFGVLCSELDGKIDAEVLLGRYERKCIGCDKSFFDEHDNPVVEMHWDHLLPVKCLWPLVDWNATPLCGDCNLEKSAKWPSEVYSKDTLKKLAALTGQSFEVLSAKRPIYYSGSIDKLRNPDYVFKLLEQYGHRYAREIKRMDKRIKADEGFSFIKVAVDSGKVSSKWLDDQEL